MPLFTLTGAEVHDVRLSDGTPGRTPGRTYTLRWTSADGLPIDPRPYGPSATEARLNLIKLFVSTAELSPGQPVRSGLTAWATYRRRGQRRMVADSDRVLLSYPDLSALVSEHRPLVTFQAPCREGRALWAEASRVFTELHGSPALGDVLQQVGLLPLQVFAGAQPDMDAWAFVRRHSLSSGALGTTGALSHADARELLASEPDPATPWSR